MTGDHYFKAVRHVSLAMAVAALLAGVALAFSLVNLRQQMTDARQHKIQSIVESAAGIVSAYRLQQMAGTLSEAQAQERALAALRGRALSIGSTRRPRA